MRINDNNRGQKIQDVATVRAVVRRTAVNQIFPNEGRGSRKPWEGKVD